MSTISECIMFTVLTSGFDSNGGGNITPNRNLKRSFVLSLLFCEFLSIFISMLAKLWCLVCLFVFYFIKTGLYLFIV